MSDVADNAPEGDVDPIKNLKSEMNRKLAGMNETNARLAQQNEQLNAKIDLLLNTVNQPKQEPISQEDMETLRYTNPDKYVDIKMKEVESKVDQKLSQVEQSNAAKQQTLSQLAADYPEISDSNSALYKRALEMGKNYPANFVSSPEGIRLIIREAAAELGVLPTKSRKAVSNEETIEDEGEDMSEFIGGGSGANKPPSGPKKKETLDPKTLAVAELMGLNINDPKVVERLKQRTKRNFKKYE